MTAALTVLARQLPFYFCSASDGTNVVSLFQDAIRAAWQCKRTPSNDLIDDVLEAVAYFDAKSKQETRLDITESDKSSSG
jgi:Rab-like protein 2